MPASVPPVSDERDALVAYVHQQQDAFRAVTFGITAEQASRAASAPSTLSLGGLVKHVTMMQEGWRAMAVAAPGPLPEPQDPEAVAAAYAEQFAFGPDDDLRALLAAYDEGCARVLEAIRTLDLDTAVPVPDAPWYPKDVTHWSVRWIWFHLIEELARHAGHADLVREAIDGATLWELIAGYEGWPETPWVKPWRARVETAEA